MKHITIENLGKTPLSDVIESVLQDIERVTKAGIHLDMDTFFDRTNTGVCKVCLAGAALLGLLDDSYLTENFPYSSSEAIKTFDDDKEEVLLYYRNFFDNLRIKIFYKSQIKDISQVDIDTAIKTLEKWKKLYPRMYTGIINDTRIGWLKEDIRELIKMLREKGC